MPYGGHGFGGLGQAGYGACYAPIAGVSQGTCIDNGALLIALAIFLCVCGGFKSPC